MTEDKKEIPAKPLFAQTTGIFGGGNTTTPPWGAATN
jgi:hypothetical protein